MLPTTTGQVDSEQNHGIGSTTVAPAPATARAIIDRRAEPTARLGLCSHCWIDRGCWARQSGTLPFGHGVSFRYTTWVPGAASRFVVRVQALLHLPSSVPDSP